MISAQHPSRAVTTRADHCEALLGTQGACLRRCSASPWCGLLQSRPLALERRETKNDDTQQGKMGCCGETRSKPVANSEKQNVLDGSYPVSQQPTPHPGLQYDEKQFQPPSIPSPPPAQQPLGSPDLNGFQQQPWQQQQQGLAGPGSPPPTSSSHTFDPFRPAGAASPPPPGAFSGTTLQSFNGTPLERPTPFYSGSVQQTVSMSAQKINGYTSPEPVRTADEGKMSVSIDFGACSVRL